MICLPRYAAAGRVMALLAAAIGLAVRACQAQVPPVIAAMVANEAAARQHQPHFYYVSDERSDRTGGHLWHERVVEVGDGMLRQLVSIDGSPLSATQAAAETQRLQELAANPDEFRKLAQAHKDDDVHATRLLQLLPHAFLITPDGMQGGCTQFRFEPDPKFQPSGYEERVGAAMGGTVAIQEQGDRLCKLQATLQHPVTFGFGLIGKVEQGGNFSLERMPIRGNEWKTRAMSVHMGGKILLAKSLARQQETVRSEIRIVPDNLTLEQGLKMIQQ